MGLMQNNDPRVLRAEQEHAQMMFDNSVSFNTRANYRSRLYRYQEQGYRLPAHPQEIVAFLNNHAAKFNTRTLRAYLGAIRFWHRINKFVDPTDDEMVVRIMAGIENTYGKPQKKAKPFSLRDMHRINKYYLEAGNTYLTVRNNALLQVGFFGALRRSELVCIKVEHLTFTPEGVQILIPKSKTDQTGKGKIIAVPLMHHNLCPVGILKKWLEFSKITQGYIFPPVNVNKIIGTNHISKDQLYLIVKIVAQECNLEEPERYSGHSLRRGFATEAARNGASMQSIMKHGRWESVQTVNGYIEDACYFKDNASMVLDIKIKP